MSGRLEVIAKRLCANEVKLLIEKLFINISLNYARLWSITIFASVLRLQSGECEDLKPVVDAGPGVESVHTGQGAVPGGLAEEDSPDPAVEQSHGAHVTGLLVEEDITACTEVTTGL